MVDFLMDDDRLETNRFSTLMMTVPDSSSKELIGTEKENEIEHIIVKLRLAFEEAPTVFTTLETTGTDCGRRI